MASRFRSRSPARKPSQATHVALLAGLALAAGIAAARADCQEDVGKLMQKREAAVALVNKSKGAGGKLDPVLACPRLKSLAVIEAEADAYFAKNKDWCNLPADLVEKMSTSAKRTSSFAGQACAFVVKLKQMQQQQAQQQQEQAPKLPTGPL